MNDNTRKAVQTIIGWIAAMIFFALAAASMAPNYELTLPVIIGAVIIVAMLLGKVEAIAALVESWKGK